MFDHRLRTVSILLWLGLSAIGPASPEDPGAGFKPDPEATVFTSPDGKMRVEQYFKTSDDAGYLYQFWTFDAGHRHPFLLNPGEGDDLAGYAAGFRFSPTVSGWYACKSSGRVTTRSFCIAEKAMNYCLPPSNLWADW